MKLEGLANLGSRDATSEGDVKITLSLPDGKQEDHTLKEGHTVAYVKALVEKNHGLPADQLVLELGGTVMIDPLTLSDYPTVRGAVITVKKA